MVLGHEYAIILRRDAEKVEYSPNKETIRKHDIENSFHKYMIEELQSLIIAEVHNQCPGCQTDHPSQIQHPTCLFLDRNDHTDMFIDKALMKINPYKIMEKWYPKLTEMKLNDSETVEAYTLWQSIKHSLIFENSDYFIDFWCEKVKQSWS